MCRGMWFDSVRVLGEKGRHYVFSLRCGCKWPQVASHSGSGWKCCYDISKRTEPEKELVAERLRLLHERRQVRVSLGSGTAGEQMIQLHIVLADVEGCSRCCVPAVAH